MNLRRFPTKRKAFRLELLVTVLLFLFVLGNVGAVTDSPLENLSVTDLSVDYKAQQRVKVVNLLPNGAIELHNYDFGDNSKASFFLRVVSRHGDFFFSEKISLILCRNAPQRRF
jgi:hypothetical protein